MVCKTLKGKFLGKDQKIKLVKAKREATEARTRREDKRWRRALSKMDAAKKAKFALLEGVSNKGQTRRSKSFKNIGERAPDTITYECTIHLQKLLKGRTFNKRAPTAIKKVRAFAQRLMRTKDNRVDASLNNHLWSAGIKGVPGRVRVRIQRKVGEAGEKSGRKHLYSVITYVPTESFKKLATEKVVDKKKK
jgi:large subunit ribosomal protein L31e